MLKTPPPYMPFALTEKPFRSQGSILNKKNFRMTISMDITLLVVWGFQRFRPSQVLPDDLLCRGVADWGSGVKVGW